MDIKSIIDKKNNQKRLTKKEIDYFVKNFSKDKITEQDATEFLKAVYNNNLNLTETTHLTMAMARSGEILDLTDVGECVDKHSTGGVSDTTTLVIVPILASLGVKVAKISGRSLGWTGGTADKVEVFQGYNNNLTEQEFKKNIKDIGACLISQSEKIAVADKKIYALRDKTGLVDNISLIASSIMSKKIACGAKVLLLDVKYGDGAFMKKPADAKKLAKVMCKIGNKVGIKTGAVISNMNEPLSNYIGNNLEVYSALQVLKDEDNNLAKLSKIIVAVILKMKNIVSTVEEGIDKATNSIKNGLAINKLKEIIKAQSGSEENIVNDKLLLKANNYVNIVAKKDGYLSKIMCAKLGNLVHNIASLEQEKESKNMVGIKLLKNKNDEVNKNDVLAVVNFDNAKLNKQLIKEITTCFKITKNKGKEFELVKEIISE